jgi:hypothetical protein
MCPPIGRRFRFGSDEAVIVSVSEPRPGDGDHLGNLAPALRAPHPRCQGASVAERPAIRASASGSMCRDAPQGHVTRTALRIS